MQRRLPWKLWMLVQPMSYNSFVTILGNSWVHTVPDWPEKWQLELFRNRRDITQYHKGLWCILRLFSTLRIVHKYLMKWAQNLVVPKMHGIHAGRYPWRALHNAHVPPHPWRQTQEGEGMKLPGKSCIHGPQLAGCSYILRWVSTPSLLWGWAGGLPLQEEHSPEQSLQTTLDFQVWRFSPTYVASGIFVSTIHHSIHFS